MLRIQAMTGPVLGVLPVIKNTLLQGRVGLLEGNFWMPWHLEKGTPTWPWGIRNGFCVEANLLKLSNIKGRGDSLSQANNQDKPHSRPPPPQHWDGGDTTLSWAWLQEDVCRVGSVVQDHRHWRSCIGRDQTDKERRQ